MSNATQDISRLEETAREIRRSIIKSLAAAGSGHSGGSLGLADVFSVLYFQRMRHRPAEPLWSERDRLILSIGHVAPVLYASLAHAGYFAVEELLSLRKLGSRLQGHPGRDHGLPGLELSAGSLGQGLSVATGMALSAKMDKASWRVYCVMGDGELQEGSVWEAAMAAVHHRLDNLTAIVDRNGLQIDGSNAKVMEVEPLTDKWRAFGWSVLECEGNKIEDIIHTFDQAEQIKDRPVIIIAHTLMGKGVPSIENDHRWHGRAPSASEAEQFLKDLEF
jgi:transketolase